MGVLIGRVHKGWRPVLDADKKRCSRSAGQLLKGQGYELRV